MHVKFVCNSFNSRHEIVSFHIEFLNEAAIKKCVSSGPTVENASINLSTGGGLDVHRNLPRCGEVSRIPNRVNVKRNDTSGRRVSSQIVLDCDLIVISVSLARVSGS